LNVTIRTAQPTDIGDLVEVLASSFYSHGGMMRWLFPIMRLGIYEDMRQRLRSPLSSGYNCLVACPSPTTGNPPILGTAEVSMHASNPLLIRSHPYPYLSNLAVHPGYRRRGIAQKLLLACERMVLEQGYQHIYLHVLEDNNAAKQLYLMAGYQLQSADPLWCSRLLRRPRRLLLYKKLHLLPSQPSH
jgi:ribosomal protein S18 acetylase RimI-like enzyme